MPGRRRSPPRRERDYRNQWGSHREHRAPPDARPVAKELVSSATGRDPAVATGTNRRRLHHAWSRRLGSVAPMAIKRSRAARPATSSCASAGGSAAASPPATVC